MKLFYNHYDDKIYTQTNYLPPNEPGSISQQLFSTELAYRRITEIGHGVGPVNPTCWPSQSISPKP